MSRDAVNGDQMREVFRRLIATIPSNLTHEEAEAFIKTGGIFTEIERQWIKQRAEIAGTLYYRKHIIWVGLLMALIVAPILNGVILSLLWDWFIVQGYGFHALPIPIAIGVMIMISLIKSNLKREEWTDRNYKERFWRVLLFPFMQGALFLGMGWIFHLFV